MKRDDRIASKVDAKRAYDKGVRVKKINRKKSQEWPDTYIDGNGRTQKSGHCAVCDDEIIQPIDGFVTVDGRLVCPYCADSTV